MIITIIGIGIGLFVLPALLVALYAITPTGKRLAAEKARKIKIEEERLAKERADVIQGLRRIHWHEREEEVRQRKIEDERRIDKIRGNIDLRDGASQNSPYTYKCVGHPNATLAIRYGIANLKKEVKEYWYHGKGGEKMKNPDRDTISIVPADTIQLQKIRKVKDDPEGTHYLAKLTDFGNREVIVVIKPSTEYVQTFYPMSEDWFKKYADLELVLKDNSTFKLKELAHFHVQKVVINS